VQRVDFEFLLDLRAALLGCDNAIADGRKRAVPEALPRVLFQRSQNVPASIMRWNSGRRSLVADAPGST